MIHFIKADDRSCKYGQPMKGKPYFVTVDPNEVTCPRCKDKDGLTLTPQGQAYVDSLDAIAKAKGESK